MSGQFLRQMPNANQAFMTEDEGAVDDIFQFAHIARPMRGHEQRQRLGGESLYGFPLQSVEPIDELFSYKGNVLLALAQRQ